MPIFVIQKTIVKEDGGVYTDAVHKLTGAEVRSFGTETTMSVRLTTYKDVPTALADGAAGRHKQFEVNVADPAIAAAFNTLIDAIYANVKVQDAELADAVDINQ